MALRRRGRNEKYAKDGELVASASCRLDVVGGGHWFYFVLFLSMLFLLGFPLRFFYEFPMVFL